MNLQKASRKKAKIKMALQGPSGSGKTYSALLVAFGLCGDWSKVALVDTENRSSELYSNLGGFNVLPLSAPFTPERYIQALEVCEKAEMEVIILDSISPEWEYLLDYHSSLQGNSFANWSRVTPRHNDFVQKIIQSNCHIISTVRTKQDYVLSEKNGKMVPEKVGLKSVQRENFDYECTLVFDINIKNHASASKDRTGLFFGQPEQRLSVEIGKLINQWCNTGADITADDVTSRINECKSITELLDLYKQFPDFRVVLKPEFEKQKRRLLVSQDATTKLAHFKSPSNGIEY